jgi:long-chain fatty acid transport protein
MRRRVMERRLLATAFGAAVAAWGGTAAAAGFQLQEQNASGLGNAYSGQAAAAEDASTVYWNPAGMTRLPGRQVYGAFSAINTSAKFDNGSAPNTSTTPFLPAPFPAVPTGIPLGGEGGDAGGWGFVPNLYLSWQLNPEVWLGLGVNAPFGLKTEWDSSWMGRFHAIESEVMSVNINPSIAWKINEMFSVGAGINAMYLKAKLTNSVAYGLSAAGAAAQVSPLLVGPVAAQAAAGQPACPVQPAPIPGLCREGVGKLEADDWGWGWNLGAMINFTPATRLGLAYRSTTKFTVKGDAKFSNAPTFTATGGVPAALANSLNAAFANGNVDADIKLPDTFSVGFSHQFDPRWQVLADYTWTGWSSIKDLSVFRSNGTPLTSTPLEFKNSWRAGVGVNYQLNNEWKLRGGVAYDTTPVQNEFRSPRLPDQDRTWLAAGAQWAFSKQGALDFGLAYLFIKDAKSELPNLDPSPPPGFRASPKGNLVGEYSANTWIISVGARYNF